jgi:hypothetical protein
MTINDAVTANEFVGSWIREASPYQAARAISHAIESQLKCLSYDESRQRSEDARNTRAALEVLTMGLAAAQQLSQEA